MRSAPSPPGSKNQVTDLYLLPFYSRQSEYEYCWSGFMLTSRRYMNCWVTTRRRRMQRNRLLKFLLVVLALIAFLHFIVLPAASGGYNDECFIPDEKRRILRTMVQNISKVFDKYDVQYWLDYGVFFLHK